MNLPVHLASLGGSVGPGELFLIFLAVLVLFGPKRLPEIARAIGKIANELRRASQTFHDQIMRLDEEPDPLAQRKSAPAAPADSNAFARLPEAPDKAAEPFPGAPGQPAPGRKDDHDLAG